MTAAIRALPGVDACADNTREERTAGMHWKEKGDGNDRKKKENEEERHEDTQAIGGVRYGFERFEARESTYGKEN